ncbi:HEAT repeat domain-containing protein [Pendulispora brunnea]|uniref:HEAT repeat domain-containing protein n=1 Tax=Pendulispora brunnea TaxID=2905690 RepID=A0ABZ2K8G3_9BACT
MAVEFAPSFLSRLTDPDASIRQLALIELEWLSSSDAVAGEELFEVLVAKVRDPDPTVRSLAVARLEDLGDARAVPALVSALEDEDEKVRETALTALREFRTEAGAAALLPGMAHPSAQVREAVIIALREHRDPRAVEPLLRATADESPRVRREAVVTLAYLRRPESVSALRERLRDPEASVRKVAIGALDFFNSPALVPDFIEVLRDDDWQVRREAAIVLGRSKVSQGIPALLEALEDRYWQVRKEAISSLGKLGATAASGALIALLHDDTPDIRKAAAQALGELRARSAAPTLTRLANDADAEVRKAARHALGLLLVLVLFVLGGCKRSEGEKPQEVIRISFGVQDSTISCATGGILVRELGLLDKYLPKTGRYANAKYEVEWKSFTSGPPITTDMVAGKIDIGLLGDFPSVANADAFRKLGKHSYYTAIIAGSVDGNGNAVLVPSDSPVTSLSELKGKQISVPFGSSAHGTLVRAIRDLGWDPDKDVTLVSQAPEVGGTALRGHKIDAHADFVPYGELFQFRKYARKIYEGGTAHVPTSVGVVARDEFADRYPEVLVGYLRATLEADRLFTEEPEKYSELVQKVSGVDAEVVYMFQGPLGLQTRDYTLKPEYRKGLETAVATLALLKKDLNVDVNAFVVDRFIRQAAKESGLDYDARIRNYAPLPIAGVDITEPKLVAQIWVKDEPKVRAYATIGAALSALGELTAGGKSTRAFYVHDRNTGSKLFADFAYFVRSGSEIAAFLLKKDAETWSRGHGNAPVVSFDGLRKS